MHIGYGIGSTLSPQIVRKFLDSRFSGGVIKTGYLSACQSNQTDSFANSRNLSAEVPIHKYPADFVVAYWLLAAVCFLLAATFMFYHIHGYITHIRVDKQHGLTPNSDKLECFKSLSPKTCSPAHPTYAGILVALCFIYYSLSLPLMRAFSKFIFSYARDGPCLSVDDATGLESAYFAAVTAGSLSAVLISPAIHMKYILQVSDRFLIFKFSFCTDILLKIFLVYECIVVLKQNLVMISNTLELTAVVVRYTVKLA